MKLFLFMLGLLALTMPISANVTTMKNLQSQCRVKEIAILADRPQGCTNKTVAVRREWGSLSKSERVAYTDAVLCLQSKPSLASPGLVPGARSRFDDFQAIHINQTFLIHFNAKLLPWHRLFTWTYEQALRNECGYKGYQPYWDWSLYSEDPASSPLFDGSPYSLSGNGQAIPHDTFTYRLPRTNVTVNIPAGTGGGCIQGGPFANMTVNLGPVNSSGSLPGFIGDGSGLDYNPRCLTRDINPFWSRRDLNYQRVTDVITHSPNYRSFLLGLQSPGMHPAGHFTIGGMNDDLFISPGDPAFFFHHAQLDHVWTIWQNLDIENRRDQLTGPTTWFNTPPGPNITLAEPMDMGFLGPTLEAGAVMSTLGGPFCYIYE